MDADQVKAAIDRLFEDTTVTTLECKQRMDDLIAHIETPIETLGV